MTSSPRVAPSRFATHFDVVIAGGGIIGSSIAYHLASAGVGAICVVERDPTYEFAATPRSNGGIRRLFSRQQNIEMAAYGLEFYRNFAATMGVDDTPAEVSFRRQAICSYQTRAAPSRWSATLSCSPPWVSKLRC